MRGAQVAEPWKVTLHVRRQPEKTGVDEEKVKAELVWDDSWSFDRIVPQSLSSPLAIPELGLAYQIKPVVAGILPNLVADNPLQVGDDIKEIQITFIMGKDQHTKTVTYELKDN